jgi:hypothetical protein
VESWLCFLALVKSTNVAIQEPGTSLGSSNKETASSFSERGSSWVPRGGRRICVVYSYQLFPPLVPLLVEYSIVGSLS